jgi:hypothetical protein
MASDSKFHSSKLSFLSALNPPCSNLVMPFKSSLPVTNSSQSLCLSLSLNPLQKTLLLLLEKQKWAEDLVGSVCPPSNSSCQSSTFISSPTSSSHGSDSPSSILAGSPKHLPPYSPTIVVTIDPEPSAPQPTLPSVPATPLPLSSPPASHTHSHTSSQAWPAHLHPHWRWQELMALSEFMCHFP